MNNCMNDNPSALEGKMRQEARNLVEGYKRRLGWEPTIAVKSYAMLEVIVGKLADLEGKINAMEHKDKLVFVGRDGWPVEGFKGRPIVTFLRRLFLAKRVIRYKTWRREGGCEIARD